MSQLDTFNFLPHLIWFFFFFIFIYLSIFFFIVPSFFSSLKIRFLFFLYTIENSCKFSWFYIFLVKFFNKVTWFTSISTSSLVFKRISFLSYFYNYLHVKFYIKNK